ncbi:MAG: cbb3-type cytochrome oxidase assembly protein CcoS [Bdellovibrionales bacterium]|nr:cbb3-type cytochrome oxidase assembly protein CcoS [Bdellovibrionales bacterium]
MEIVWWLVPAALAMGAGFLIAFIWSARNGQYEDLETPAVRILFEEESKNKKEQIDAAGRTL